MKDYKGPIPVWQAISYISEKFHVDISEFEPRADRFEAALNELSKNDEMTFKQVCKAAYKQVFAN